MSSGPFALFPAIVEDRPIGLTLYNKKLLYSGAAQVRDLILMDLDEFRQRIRNNELDFLLESVLLGDGASHVSLEHIAHIQQSLAKTFQVPADDVRVWIVGSAKLGFALTEKRLKDGSRLRRYRRFSAMSDVDVAVVSPVVFDIVWNELSAFAHRETRLPWDSGALGDYLVCGWLRPDHFPVHVRLRNCDDWWDLFRSLSADSRYGRRKVRGGLFHSVEHMKRYQIRALKECASVEALGV
jgi:hypothetical protein